MKDDDACPHCGKTLHDLWEYDDLRYDGDSVDVECGYCEKSITISLCISADYIVSLPKHIPTKEELDAALKKGAASAKELDATLKPLFGNPDSTTPLH